MTNGGGAGVKMSEREMEDMLDEVFRKVLGERW
jgi:hypothetical protein